MARLRHLVVVIPGIGGSVLTRGGETGETIWDAGRASIVKFLRDPGRLELAEADGVAPHGLIGSHSIVPGWAPVYGYDELLRQITNAFGRQDRDTYVRPFAYDFRRSVTDTAAELDKCVDEWLGDRSEEQRRHRVIVVAHSLGGLVARHWLGPGKRWRWCRALITLGTPHRGAPKALDWLVNGVGVSRLRCKEATAIVRRWPAVYELLPRYRMIWNEATRQEMYPHELRMEGFDHEQAAAAFKVHEEIEQEWAEIPAYVAGGPEVIPVVGHGQATLESASLGGRLHVTKDAPPWLYEQEWHGDGTVPAWSAKPVEFDNPPQATWQQPLRHGRLAQAQEAVYRLREISDKPHQPIRGGPPERRVVLGLELGELHLAGEGVPLTVALRNAPEGAKTGALSATVRKAGSPRPLQQQWLDRDGDFWSLVVTGLTEGIYEVTVEAVGVPGDPPKAHDVFGVVEP